MSCATCPIPEAGCMTDGIRMAHTTCFSCGKGFTCEGGYRQPIGTHRADRIPCATRRTVMSPLRNT